MWTKEFFGMDVYHILTAFLIYSAMGWLIESIYMSICNRKITNRGFAKGPFCPIYGFGAMIGYIVLHPLQQNVVLLYLSGAVLATVFEYLVGLAMKKIFGIIWWDYNDKPFNYKGMICLESTIAWGFYAIGIVFVLHATVMRLIDKYPAAFNRNLIIALYAVLLVDYIIQILNALHIDWRGKLSDKYKNIKARWY